jgi:hypothetical protein
VQVFDRGLRLLDGAIQMQELLIERPEAETNGSVPSTGNLVVGAAIADPFVVLKMADGALQLVVGGIFHHSCSPFVFVLWRQAAHCYRKEGSNVLQSSLRTWENVSGNGTLACYVMFEMLDVHKYFSLFWSHNIMWQMGYRQQIQQHPQ